MKEDTLMKKFLSLVLALVMTFSLVTISAGATEYKDLTDKSTITYSEAVAVLNKLGVITGYEDGSFQPTGSLTRGAAAKIIVSMMIGADAASSLTASTAPYKDVPVDNTFAAYISYCKTAGYISGYSDGTFRPADTLTGYAFAKMLLGALGYSSSTEGFTGEGWTMNVAKIGNVAGLFKGISGFSGNTAVTREVACQMALNTLKATEVEYNGDNINVSAGSASVSITNSKYSEVKNSSGVDYANAGSLTTQFSTMQFCEEHFADLKLTTSTANDVFGRPASTWKYKNSEVGTFANVGDRMTTYTGKVTLGTLYTLLGSTNVTNLANGSNSLTVYVDGVAQDVTSGTNPAVKLADIGNYIAKNSTGASSSTGKGTSTEVYMNSDGDVTIVVINTYLAKAAADYSSTKGALAVNVVSQPAAGTVTSISNDDFAVSGFKADDYILFTYANGAVQSVAKAQTVTGSVGTYTDSDSVTIAGTKYSYSAKVTAAMKATAYTTGSDATVVLDAQGNIIAVDEATVSSKDFVYVSQFASPSGLSSSAVAQAYFADGSEAAITVKNVDGVTNPATIIGYGTTATYTHWYTFSKDSNGKYTLTTPAGYTSLTSSAAVTNATVTFTTGINGNASTVFVVLDKDNNVKLYTGIANVPSVTGGTIATSAAVKDGYAKYVFINASAATTITNATTDNSNILYILEAAKTAKDSDGTYYTYVALVNGEKQTIETTVNTFAVGNLYYNVQMNTAKTRYTSGSAIASGATGQYQFSGSGTKYTVSHSSGVMAFNPPFGRNGPLTKFFYRLQKPGTLHLPDASKALRLRR